MLARFASASEKIQDESDDAIRDQQKMMKGHQAMMMDQQSLLRNQQASILNIEKQLGQLAKQFNERTLGGLPSDTEKNPKSAHINIVTTRSGKIVTPLTPIPSIDQKEAKEKDQENLNSPTVDKTR